MNIKLKSLHSVIDSSFFFFKNNHSNKYQHNKSTSYFKLIKKQISIIDRQLLAVSKIFQMHRTKYTEIKRQRIKIEPLLLHI